MNLYKQDIYTMATVLQIPHCFSSKAISSSTPQIGKINILCGSISSSKSVYNSRLRVRAVKEKTEEINNPSSAEEVTKKYGLEAGLWKKERRNQRDYQVEGRPSKGTPGKIWRSIFSHFDTLSLISFGLCYALISAGVDVPALLQKVPFVLVGISSNETGEKVGTFALAYAAHKAASPIRFPPTVALTPIVASWIGKKVDQEK
ncbi:hypothetical protein DH2020_000492 [Rehmannia glutinosa]|uniref:DUF1279 domain-containing protein n=1 Tax=Rehmannia glutinosa TaxID=99300 RepID=A0ABR0XX34_REHGL